LWNTATQENKDQRKKKCTLTTTRIDKEVSWTHAVFFALVPGGHVTREMVHEPGEDTFTMTPCGACLARLLVP